MSDRTRSPAAMARWVNAREHPERSRRVRINVAVILEFSFGSQVKALIEDLSQDGFRLKSEVPLRAGQVFKMRLPREVVDCELRWVDGYNAGGVFQQRAKAPQW